MECIFKLGFENLKKEILENNSKIKHLINLNDELNFVKGVFKTFESYDYMFCTNIHPAIIKKLKELPGIFYQEKYIFGNGYPMKNPAHSKYEYIIKIEDKEKYNFSEPLILNIKEEYRGKKRDEKVLHSGYYGSSKWTGLSFNNSGVIGFLAEDYIPMLKGETIRREHRGGRWNKLYGFTEYSISGEESIKEFIIRKNQNQK